jgi:hypothetical protein
MPDIKFVGATPRRSRKSRPKSTREIVLKNPQDQIGLIYGIKPGSSWEWNHARALWALGWDFQYQVPLWGGRRVRGGVVLDFLIPTVPTQTILRVMGEYWHRDTDAEDAEDLHLLDYFGSGTVILRVGTADSATFEDALAYDLKHIGRGPGRRK